MALENRRDIEQAIADRGFEAVESELLEGDYGASLADISEALYTPWGRQRVSKLLAGTPVAMEFGKSTQSALGRLNRLRAGVSPQFQLNADIAAKQGEKKAQIERQKRANQFALTLPSAFRGSLGQINQARANRLGSANLAGGTALGLVGGGLGIAGTAMLTNPITAIPGAILAAIGGGTGIASAAAQKAEADRIAKQTAAGGKEIAAYDQTFGVDVSALPAGFQAPGLAGALGRRFRLTGQEEETPFSDALSLYNPPSMVT